MNSIRLKVTVVVLLVFVPALSFFAIFFAGFGTTLLMRQEIKLSFGKIEIISEEDILMPGRRSRHETLNLVRIPENPKVAILNLTASSTLIVRSPEQDSLAQAALGSNYPVYTAYNSYVSFALHVIFIYLGAAFSAALAGYLFCHLIWMVRAIKDFAKARSLAQANL